MSKYSRNPYLRVLYYQRINQIQEEISKAPLTRSEKIYENKIIKIKQEIQKLMKSSPILQDSLKTLVTKIERQLISREYDFQEFHSYILKNIKNISRKLFY